MPEPTHIGKTIRLIIILEAAGFLLLAAAIWLNELFDLPHHLFGTPITKISYSEAIFESIFVLLLGAIVITITWHLAKRIAQLENLLPICSFCKKIRKPEADPEKQESWEPVEMYINERTGTLFSHGLCPECLKNHYG